MLLLALLDQQCLFNMDYSLTFDEKLVLKFKSFIEFCSFSGKVCFFSRPREAIEIDDPIGFVNFVCLQIDGKNTCSDIMRNVNEHFPCESKYAFDLIRVLDSAFLLEKAHIDRTDTLTEYDLGRWTRNVEFFGSYCQASQNKFSYQDKIKNLKVGIVGLGGVGSSVFYNLAAIGVLNYKIIDFDKVELSNLNRQILYRRSDIGKPKSEAAKNNIKDFLPESTIYDFNQRISSVEQIEEFVFDQDIIIGAADSPRESIIDWINLACVRQKKPFVCGALDSRSAIYYSVIPKKSGCIECWKSDARLKGYVFQDILKNKNFKTADSQNVSIMPYISVVSGLIVSEVINIVTGLTEPAAIEKLKAFDFISSETRCLETWSLNPDCPVCS